LREMLWGLVLGNNQLYTRCTHTHTHARTQIQTGLRHRSFRALGSVSDTGVCVCVVVCVCVWDLVCAGGAYLCVLACTPPPHPPTPHTHTHNQIDAVDRLKRLGHRCVCVCVCVCVCLVCVGAMQMVYTGTYACTLACARTPSPPSPPPTHTPSFNPHTYVAAGYLVCMHTQAPPKLQVASDTANMLSKVSSMLIHLSCCFLRGVYWGGGTRHAIKCFVC
jgi:hypothetical protein